MFEQLSTAVVREATSLWILNVGDLKPNELATEFFLAYAYDASKWTPSNLRDFVAEHLNRDPDVASTETNLIFEHTRAAGRR